jgi:hypothetical protein
MLVTSFYETKARGTVTYRRTALRGDIKGTEVWRKPSKSAVK